MSNSHASLGKRFLSVLLVLVMVIGMLPTIAFAEGGSDDTLSVTLYEKVTSPDGAGNYLIADGTTAITYSGSSFGTATLTAVVPDTYYQPNGATVWTASQSGTSWQFNSGTSYLGLTRSSSNKIVYKEYTYSFDLVAKGSSFNAWKLSAGKLSMNVMTEDYVGSSFDVYADYYLSYNNGTLSVTDSFNNATTFTFYKEVEVTNTDLANTEWRIGKDEGGNAVLYKPADLTATATAVADPEGTAWDAANDAWGSSQKVLGIWDVTLKYGETAMQTVVTDVTVKIYLDSIVKENDKVYVAHWNGESFGAPDEKTVTKDANGLYVEATTKDNNPFVVYGTYTLVGTDASDNEVWGYNEPVPTVDVTADPVLTPADDFEDALNAANKKWGGLDLALYDVVAKYGTTVMKKLETPVDVTIDGVTGVKKNGAVMVAHWNGSFFDTPIQAKAPDNGKVTFKADTFSPFVVIGGIGYNSIFFDAL